MVTCRLAGVGKSVFEVVVSSWARALSLDLSRWGVGRSFAATVSTVPGHRRATGAPPAVLPAALPAVLPAVPVAALPAAARAAALPAVPVAALPAVLRVVVHDSCWVSYP